MGDIVLETPRLALRRWVEGDQALWREHLNTAQVKRHLGGVETPEKIAERFAGLFRAWDEDGFSFLAVERREDGAFLGTCGVARIAEEPAPRELEGAIQIGWQLRTDAWGQGYATEAASHMLEMAFARFGWDQIYAQTSESNRPSWRVMQRLGMRRCAEFDYVDPAYPPEDNPTMIWSIAREDWRAAA